MSSELPHGPTWALRDSWNEAGRHLRVVPRNPETLIFAAVQPVMFILLFVYVFGTAVKVPGYANYKQYLMPGIFAQTVVFGSAFTGIGLAEDLSKGFIDRLRSLPITQSAVLFGRTLSDLVRNTATFVVMVLVAFIIGFRIHGSVIGFIGASFLLLYFSYAFSWVQALIGLSVNSVETANSAGFIWMFPLTFLSSAFVSTAGMTPWLRRVADANPFTRVANAARALYNGNPTHGTVWQAFGWATLITVVFATLSIRKFSRVSSR